MYEPDFLIMVEETELKISEDYRFTELGIKKGSTVLINTSKPKNTFSSLKSLKDCNVITLDAYRIASEKGLALPAGEDRRAGSKVWLG